MEVKLEELLSLVKGETVKPNPFTSYIGKIVFIRTVTYHLSGKVEETCGDFVKLSTGAWIADSGRYSQAVASGEFSETEIYKNPVHVNIQSIIDFTEIPKATESQK
jgi:hypothetical protein